MAGEYKLPPTGGSYADALARVQAIAESTENLNRKSRELQETEERGDGIEQSNVTVRSDLAGATNKLSSALRANINVLDAETGAVLRSTEALRAKLAVVNELRAATATGATSATVASSAAPVTGAASLEQAQLRNAALVEQRLVAERQAAQARAQPWATPLGGSIISPGQRDYLATGGLGGAGSLATLEAERRLGLTQFNVPREPLQIAQFSSASRYRTPEAPALVPLTGQSAFATDEAGRLTEAGKAAQAYERDLGSMVGKLGELDGAQALANQRFQVAGATYANASTALSRHGALTTEFISALSRGEVTLQEFGSQVTATIGKFGGWAIAAGAVYGVYDALKHVLSGATETQGAVQNLGRFIPGLGGPAGGGTGQIPAAEGTLRNLAQQFNVPIKEVSESMQVMARTFHTVTDAGQATAAVLALNRLDQVPQSQSEQFLVGIGNSLGITRGSGLVNVVNQLNALQAGTPEFPGARVVQTLPGLARATPAAIASGVSQNQLETLVALGVRGGLPGAQVGTALLRSMTNFAFSSSAAVAFAPYGIRPEPGKYGDLFEQVFRTIDERARSGTLRGTDLSNLARALGGPFLGGRSILPILAQEAQHPGAYQAGLDITHSPRPYQEDLNSLLGSIGEQFKMLGTDLQVFGSDLASLGIATPLHALLTVTNDVAHVLQFLLQPLGAVAGVFNELPGPVRDAIGLFIAFKATQAFLGTRAGGIAQNFVGRVPGLGEFGIGQDQAIVQGFAARSRTYLLPGLQREVENATARSFSSAAEEQRRAATVTGIRNENLEWAGYIDRNLAPPGLGDTPAFKQYSERLGTARSAAETAVAQAARDREDLAAKTGTLSTQQADTEYALTAGKRGGPSFSDAARVLQATGNVTAQDNQVATQLKEARLAQLRAVEQGVEVQVQQNRIVAETVPPGVGGRAGGAASEALGAAAIAAAVPLALQTAARDSSDLGDLAQTVAQARARGAVPLSARPTSISSPGAPFIVGPNGEITNANLPAYRPPAAAGAGELQAVLGLSGLGAGVVRSGAQLEQALSERGLLSRTFGEGGLLRGTSGLFLGTTGLALASSAFGQGSAPGNALQGASSGLMAALFARFANAGVGVQGLVGIGTQIGSAFQTGGTSAGLASLAGGGVGAAIGAGLGLLGGPFAPLTSTAGAVIGGTLGSFVGNLLGQGPSPQDQATQAQSDALKQIGARARLSNNAAVVAAYEKFGSAGGERGPASFALDVWSAFAGGGAGGRGAQQRLSSEIPGLQAEQFLFGPRSTQGKVASAQLSELIQGAVEGAGYNPQLAQQALQAAEQSREQAVQKQLQYGLSQAATPGQAQAAADTATKAYQQQLHPYQQALSDTIGAQGVAQKELHNALDSGNKTRIAAAKHALDQATTATSGARALLQQATESKALQIQQAQQAAYQVEQQTLASQGALAEADAGGNQAAQLKAQLQKAQRDEALARTQLTKPFADTQKLNSDIRNARAAQEDVRTKQAQQGLTELKAQGQVAAAQVFTGDPVGQARQAATNARQAYDYILQHRHAFDPSDIAAALAAVISANQGVAQAISDYNTQMIQVRTQIRQAESYGNSVQQAAEGLQGAAAQLQAARTPAQRAQARLAYANAQDAAFQAQEQRITEQGALAQSQAAGDPLRQAALTVQFAQKTLAAAHGIDNIIQAQAALNNANYAYVQAQEQHAVALAGLQASETPNQLQQLQDQIRGQANALRIAQQHGDVSGQLSAQTSLNQLKLQYQSTLISQRESTIQFNLDMYRITYSQAIQQLKALLKVKDITIQQRQQIQEQIRQLELSGSTPGQFDLGPSGAQVKLPTVYDVLRSAGLRPHLQGVSAPGQQANLLHIGAGGRGVHHEYHNLINVYVRHAGDVPAVADAIDRTLNSHVRARLRAAGLRGS